MSIEKETSEPKTIPIFPLIRKLTKLRLREGLAMEYALSIIMDSQPQINLLGQFEDQITTDQVGLVIDGIREGGHRWRNLIPLARITPPQVKNSVQD